MQNKNSLNSKEIQLIKDFSSKGKITNVCYYFWINVSNPDQQYSFIDVIEYIAEDATSLFFKLNEEDSGIEIKDDFDFEQYKINVQTEFQNQIRLIKVEASPLEIWKEVLHTSFEQIIKIKDKENFLNTLFLIEFKEQKIEIQFHPVEGLVVEEYEEI